MISRVVVNTDISRVNTLPRWKMRGSEGGVGFLSAKREGPPCGKAP